MYPEAELTCVLVLGSEGNNVAVLFLALEHVIR